MLRRPERIGNDRCDLDFVTATAVSTLGFHVVFRLGETWPDRPTCFELHADLIALCLTCELHTARQMFDLWEFICAGEICMCFASTCTCYIACLAELDYTCSLAQPFAGQCPAWSGMQLEVLSAMPCTFGPNGAHASNQIAPLRQKKCSVDGS